MELPSFAELMRFHGGSSPAGVAHAFKVLERGLPLLGPVEREELRVRTAFGGPGARDAFECATGSVPEIDPSLARPELGRERERFVFELSAGERTVTLVLRDGFVPPEFIDLARIDNRSEAEERRLDELKAELRDRLLAAPAEAVYDRST